MRDNGSPGAWITTISLVVALGSMPSALSAQTEMVGPRMASRADLTVLLDSLQNSDTSILTDSAMTQLGRRVQALAYRLERGDVWPGDVIQLDVRGEDRWTSQFTVTPSRVLELPDIDPVSLEGVLYAEVEESVSLQLAKYLREPNVRADVLKRIGILGQVANPGFFTMPGSTLISEAIMIAGGPGGTANINKVIFRRLGLRVAWEEQWVAWRSMSLDELGIISGDEMFIPEKSSLVMARVLAFVLGTVATITIIAIRL